MRSIFISDAHIKGLNSPQQNLLCRFLDSLREDTESLFILGDFFDFWFGFSEVVPYPYLPVLSKLLELKERGIKIVYVEGNHDFFMGPFFRDVLRAEVFPEEATLYLAGRKVLLAHGDLVDRGDYGYRLLRWLLRSRPFQALASLIPPFLLLRLARRLSGMSRRFRHRGQTLNEALRGFARRKWQEGYRVVILSHSHTPEVLQDGRGRLYINTGDWVENFTYLELKAGTFTLKRYDPSLTTHESPLQSVSP